MNRILFLVLTGLVGVYSRLFVPTRVAHASRDNDRVLFKAAPGAASGSGTTALYFVAGQKLRLKTLHLVGINPAAVDGDTLSVVVDYSTDGSVFTACGTVAAVEYNDSDNTMALTALLPNEKINENQWTVNDVPADALIRVRIIWTGTVTDGNVEAHVGATTK